MKAFDFNAYITDYNLGDDDATAERWYAKDIRVRDGFRVMAGRDQLLGFLGLAHDGVAETLKPLVVFNNEKTLMAQLDIELRAQRDLPDYPLGPLRKNDMATMKFFARYEIVDGKIDSIELAYWPMNLMS